MEKDHSPQLKQLFATPLFYTVVTLIQVVRQDLNVNQLKLKLTASKKSDEPQKVDDLLKEQKQKKVMKNFGHLVNRCSRRGEHPVITIFT